MSLQHPRDELRALRTSVRALRAHFLAKHLGAVSLQPLSKEEMLDVAAFAVLLHGHLEGFFEGLALWRLEWAVDDWTLQKPLRLASAALLWHCAAPDYATPMPNIFNGVREALAAGKGAHSAIIKQNHGIEYRHLRTLFYRLGVDLPSSPQYEAALDQLIKLRHEWAHRGGGGAEVQKPAADLEKIADDCMTLARELSRRVAKRAA